MAEDRPRIGDFTRPSPLPAVKTEAAVTPPAPTPTGETAARLEATEKRLEKEAEAAEKEVKPLQAYEEALKLAGMSRDEASNIFDQYLENGYYIEEFQLSARIKGKFRSRAYADTLRLQDYLEITQPKFQSTQQEATFRYLLAGSLVKFHKKDLPFPEGETPKKDRDKAFDERLQYIDGLGDAIVRLLFEKLQVFDQRVAVALREGSVPNF